MKKIPSNTETAAAPPLAAPPKPSKEVVLAVLLEIFSRYERGAAELTQELELPEITIELLMLVCLAAPQVDDLILGFIRDDLRVVSMKDQVSQMVARDFALVRTPLAQWTGGGARNGLSEQLQQTAETDTQIVQKGSIELQQFVDENKELYENFLVKSPAVMARLVMLYLMREANARQRGSAVLAAWRDGLAPAAQERVRSMQARYMASPAAKQRIALVTRGQKATTGPKIGGF